MLIFDVKKYIEDAVYSKFESHGRENDISHLFSRPLISYASATNPLFMAFFDKEWTSHPKGIYRPSNTVVVHFLPFAPGLSQDDLSLARDRSILFAAILNDVIKEALEKLGRLASLTGLPGDWDKEKDDFYWSHKLAAFVAGMGDFGSASSFNTKAGNLGRFDSVLTEMIIEPSYEWPQLNEDAINDILQSLTDAQRFGPSGELSKDLPLISQAIIDSCPAGAINENYIDKQKCRDYCRGLGAIAPSPDACALCFNPHSI